MNPPVNAHNPSNVKKRIIGPIPPRDKHGRMMLLPNMGRKVKTNVLGEPVRDDRGNPVEIDADLREDWEYKVYEPGCEKFVKPEALKGLRLFQVDLDVEPIALIYARDERHALEVYKKEMGVVRFGDKDPVINPAE